MARQDRKTIGLIALPPAASRQRAERSSTGTEDSWEMKLTASEPDFILKGCEPRTSSATALESAILPSPWCQCVSMPPGGTLPLADGVAAATRCRTAPPARPGCLRPPTVRRRRRDFVRVVVRAQDDDVRRLERLFHEVSGGEDDTSCRHELVDGQTVFHNLPLWRVQWAAAPGMVQLVHAHVPHYVHMFRTMLAKPKPWRFCHLYLPGGPKNLDLEEYGLEPGSSSPLLGVLMEVTRAVEMADGRLLVVAVGIARIRVCEASTKAPFHLAKEARLVVDDDAMAAFAPRAAELLMGAARAYPPGTEPLPLQALVGVAPSVQQAMLCASILGWADYELAVHRVAAPDKLELSTESDMETLAALAVDSGGFCPLPSFFLPGQGGEPAPGPTGRLRMLNITESGEVQDLSTSGIGGEGSIAACFRAGDVAPAVSFRVETAGRAAAEAAVRSLRATVGGDWSWQVGESRLGYVPRRFGHLGVPGSGGWPFRINSVMDRGLRVSWGGGDTGAEGGSWADQDAWALLGGVHSLRGEELLTEIVRLEKRVWDELDAVVHLSQKLSDRAPSLPSGLACLRPPPAEGEGATAAGAGAGAGAERAERTDGTQPQGCADADYPALRRAHRLSFAVLSVMAETSQDEGRQAWLETNGLAARLDLSARLLAKHRGVLAALAAVKGVGG